MVKRFWKDRDPLKDRTLIGGGVANMKELRDEPPRQIIESPTTCETAG
jgi:hypothetical protein